jgi:hypothetical protein
VSPIELFVSRLDGARRVGRNSYVARCPAHKDRSPSLSVGIGREGRVLVHCFAGCSTHDVLAAVGLSISDLFPERVRDLSPLERDERRCLMREGALVAAICVVDHEAAIVAAAATMIDRGQELSGADRARLACAVRTIGDARDLFDNKREVA